MTYSNCYVNNHFDIDVLKYDWEQLCEKDCNSLLDIKVDPKKVDEVWNILKENYTDKSRHYHNFAHITNCIVDFDNYKNAVDGLVSWLTLRFAIWFHDVVYDTKSNQNEENSAFLARELLAQMQLPEYLCTDVSDLILATKHAGSTDVERNDIKVFLDIDLAILGEPPPVFDVYCENIRKEYSWVPENVYREKRAEILKGFLSRPLIYNTQYFQDHCEVQARRNLCSAIARG